MSGNPVLQNLAQFLQHSHEGERIFKKRYEAVRQSSVHAFYRSNDFARLYADGAANLPKIKNKF